MEAESHNFLEYRVRLRALVVYLAKRRNLYHAGYVLVGVEEDNYCGRVNLV